MLKPIVLILTFLSGVLVGVYGLAPVEISESERSTEAATISGETGPNSARALAKSELPSRSEGNNNRTRVSVNPKLSAADPVAAIGDERNAAQALIYERLHEGDLGRKGEQQHHEGISFQQIPSELLPPIEDIKLHKEMELARRKLLPNVN